MSLQLLVHLKAAKASAAGQGGTSLPAMNNLYAHLSCTIVQAKNFWESYSPRSKTFKAAWSTYG